LVIGPRALCHPQPTSGDDFNSSPGLKRSASALSRPLPPPIDDHPRRQNVRRTITGSLRRPPAAEDVPDLRLRCPRPRPRPPRSCSRQRVLWERIRDCPRHLPGHRPRLPVPPPGDRQLEPLQPAHQVPIKGRGLGDHQRAAHKGHGAGRFRPKPLRERLQQAPIRRRRISRSFAVPRPAKHPGRPPRQHGPRRGALQATALEAGGEEGGQAGCRRQAGVGAELQYIQIQFIEQSLQHKGHLDM
ncbi:hypothetical protein CCMA1212_001870, partial [Trichoderma ghanense]